MVVLPEPERPMMPKMLPGGALNDTPSRAGAASGL